MNPLVHGEERSLNGNQKRPPSSNLGDDANRWTKRPALSTPSDRTSVPGNIDTDSSHTYLSSLTVDTPTTQKTAGTTTTWVEGNSFPYSGGDTTELTKTSGSTWIDQQRGISNHERVSISVSHPYASKHAEHCSPAKGGRDVELPIVATASEAEAIAMTDNNSVSRDSTRVSIFEISALGANCTICQTSVGTSDSAISHHLKTHHASLRTTIKNLSGLARNVRSKFDSAKEDSGRIRIPLQETLMFKCPTCDRAYRSMQAFHNHRRKSKDAACLNTHAIKTTTSPRTPALNASNPRAKNDQISNPFPKPTFSRVADFASAERVLSRHIRDDESVETYIPLFTPFIGGMTDFDTDIFQCLTSCCPKILTSDPKHLSDILNQAEKWLMERARYEVSMIPANLRAALLKFDYQDIGEVTHNLTFTFRHKAGVLLSELKKLLSFLWRSRSRFIAQFRRNYHKDDPFFVQRLLVACVLEKVDNIHSHPLLVEYCLVRCFKGTSPEKLSMIQAGDVSSICSTVMSILRSSVCSVICTFEQSLESRAEVLIRDTQRSRTLNTIAPMIRRLRDIQRKKPSDRLVTTDPEGNISVDGYEFPRAMWSQVIPVVFQELSSMMSVFFRGEEWRSTLDTKVPISVSKGGTDGDLSFNMVADGRSISSDNLQISEDIDVDLIDKCVAYLQLCFHGFGLGSMRLQELEELGANFVLWHRSTVYYTYSSIKVFSHKTKPSLKKVQHKLPMCIARAYLLFRVMVQRLHETLDSQLAVPSRCNKTFTMQEAIAEVFRLAQKPTATQIRQFWCSVSNVVFPSGDVSDRIKATGEAAEASGHTAGTHAKKYPTTLVDGKEYLFLRYHASLGDMGAKPPNGSELTDISADNLKDTLRHFFGESATFTSDAQETLVSTAAFSKKHIHVDMPCGAGKSLAWNLPLAARLSTGHGKRTMSIVILPYKFLTGFQLQASKNLLEQSTTAWIVSFSSSDFGNQKIPSDLKDQDFLPDMMILSLDALASLLDHQLGWIRSIARKGKIHRIFIDEIHTIFLEGFRSVYEHLPRLAALGVPIMTLSGTVPPAFLPCMLQYLGLSCSPSDDTTSIGDVQLVSGGDVTGDYPSEFRIGVTEVLSPRMAAESIVAGCMRQTPGAACHVIVNSKNDAQLIHEKLSRNFESRIVTSQSTGEEQFEIARHWKESEFQVLVSTSIALVGNENPKCRHVVIVGYLFNLLSLVQAIGRLRPSQRSRKGSIKIILPIRSKLDFNKDWDDEYLKKFVPAKERGLVPPDITTFKKFAAMWGLHDILCEQGGCLLVNISKSFGKTRHQCGVCDYCVSRPIKQSAAYAKARAETALCSKQEASSVWRSLNRECPVCQSTNCDGDTCYPLQLCYQCGAKDHMRKDCKVDWTTVLRGKACYSCFDPYHREGYVNHTVQEGCPLKRRFKRLLFERCRLKGDQNIREFVAGILSEEDKLNSFLARAKPKQTSQQPTTVETKGPTKTRVGATNKSAARIIKLKARQVGIDHKESPLLPPDVFDGNRDMGTTSPKGIDNASEARNLFQFLRQEPMSSKRQRRFVYGTKYKNLWSDVDYLKIDSFQTGNTFEIEVDIDGRVESTKILVFNASHRSDLLKGVLEIGSCLEKTKQGNARDKMNDTGEMFGLGYKSRKTKVEYNPSKTIPGIKRAMEKTSRCAVRFMEQECPHVLTDIRWEQNTEEVFPNLQAMGGEDNAGSSIMFSRNLGNAAHIDLDSSLSISFWAEKKPGVAENWYFVLPDVLSGDKKGLIIRLFHGAVIVWDGRVINHCSSVPNPGSSNDVYGCMFGYCR